MKTRTVSMMTSHLSDYITYLGTNGAIVLAVRDIDHIQPFHVEVTFGYNAASTI